MTHISKFSDPRLIINIRRKWNYFILLPIPHVYMISNSVNESMAQEKSSSPLQKTKSSQCMISLRIMTPRPLSSQK